jgi:hypothetical protein
LLSQIATPEKRHVHTLYTSGEANRDLGECLDQELKERGIASPGATICGEIIRRVFERAAEIANRRPLTADEAEEITKRSL